VKPSSCLELGNVSSWNTLRDVVRYRHFRVKDVTCPLQAKPDTQAMILVKEDRLSGAVVALPSLDSSEHFAGQ
jgi:hypothetical protein